MTIQNIKTTCHVLRLVRWLLWLGLSTQLLRNLIIVFLVCWWILIRSWSRRCIRIRSSRKPFPSSSACRTVPTCKIPLQNAKSIQIKKHTVKMGANMILRGTDEQYYIINYLKGLGRFIIIFSINFCSYEFSRSLTFMISCQYNKVMSAFIFTVYKEYKQQQQAKNTFQ